MGGIVLGFRTLVLITVALQVLVATQAAPAANLVPSLPGQPTVAFNQYAGYITVDQSNSRKLFYYFVEATNSSATNPLVLWLNGDPGCSSLKGAFSELGPFYPNASGDGLIANEDSWNQVANIIFLDIPVGTGFSYSKNASDYTTTLTDLQTAEDALAFLLGWLAEYPEYNSTDFYIAGESYAGHFVLRLASAVLDYNNEDPQAPILLQGIVLVNPFLTPNMANDRTHFEYAWAHGMISEATYSKIVRECNSTISSPACTRAQSTAERQISGQLVSVGGSKISLLNPKDVLADVCLESGAQALQLNGVPTRMDNPCIGNQLKKYLNLPEVKSSLHAEVSRWDECSRRIAATYNKTDLATSMIPVLTYLVSSNLRVWVYSGDQDLLAPVIGTQRIVTTVADDLNLNTTFDYQLWLHGSQIGGWSMGWRNGSLVFATIRGAGHEAPGYQPARALVLFTSFLAGDNSPPLQHASG